MGIVIGSRFGKLVVLEDAGSINGHPAFFCRCDCGNFKRIKRSKLLTGHDVSCGDCKGVRRPKAIVIVHGIAYQ
jgi:hypothetical protein